MYPFLIRRRPCVLSPLSRCLFGLLSSVLLGVLFLGSPPSVAAQTCAENSTAVNNRGAALAGDCTTLLGLKDTLRGTASLNWATSVNMDSWDGITVAGTPARVTELDFESGDLTGTLPSALGSLTGLTTLNFAQNFLTGTIPSTLGNLTNLTNLWLGDNQLTGTIPSQLGNLSNLAVLELEYNQLTGTIPSQLGNLSNLTELSLGGNSLTGSIPTLSSLTALETLYLAANQLTGSIPAVNALTKLEYLDLSFNQLTGSIPALSALTKLEYLDLSFNQLTGSIPALSSLTKLEHLYLHNNQLTGTIPALSALTALETLDLANNNFTAGAIPSGLTSLTELDFLDLSFTNRTGTIPDLSTLSELGELHLSGNQLSGAIPTSLGSLSQLSALYLNNNQLSGAIPSQLGNLSLGRLDLSHNAFDAGAIPTWVSNLTSLVVLGLNSTNRNGAIPDLSGATHLWRLDLANNNFTAGAIPTWVSNLIYLGHLDLSSTNRTGTIPSTLNDLTYLGYLDLSHNQLTGSIPRWGYLPNLEVLDLSYNQLSGILQAGQNLDLSSLRVLDYSHNQLSGSIPSEFGYATTLEEFDLSHNQLSGSIPTQLGNMRSLTHLDLSYNRLSGSVPSTFGNLTKLKELYIFSGNQLSGALPPGLPPGLETDLAGQPGDIQGFFESPANGATVSGVDIIRGWSFSEAARVGIEQVTLYLDGQRYAVIPCCSTRPDVAQAKPDFPAANTGQSGWGTTYNWSNLSPGPHTVQVVVTGADEGRWVSDQHTITVVKPGGIAFADQFSLAEAEARLESGHLVLDGVVIRDKATQVEHEIVARYAWQTGAQGLRLVASRPIQTARTQPFGLERLLAGVWQWGAGLLSPASVTANDGITAFYEAPLHRARVAGIGLIRGWAFPDDPTDAIASVTVQIGATLREDAPCCSTRPDVALVYPEAADSGWGMVFNYGNLPEGEHDLSVYIETEAGVVAPPETHTVTVSRLGGYAFVNRFDLSGAEVDLVGEEVILSGVEVRDSATQATQVIEVRLEWSAATQGLVIVDTALLP